LKEDGFKAKQLSDVEADVTAQVAKAAEEANRESGEDAEGETRWHGVYANGR